ncbi:MAG: radical SAM family heme chaperone HemW, partial [Chlorobi bacterium]|nr:radical SAM family heme chaperone HemW [Chlorobiota bacterium]
MAGVYIHIPFCKQRCHYCNFYSVVSEKYRKPFLKTLLFEIEQRKDYLKQEKINTIYLGGGTPSLYGVSDLITIIEKIMAVFNVSSGVEITLEANPDDLNATFLKQLKNETLINRLSIGIQSFFDDDLEYLNRVHDAKQSYAAIELAKKYGFDNLTIDLIYGIPGLTEEKWIKNLETFFSFGLPHLSSYSLTVEPKTALSTLIRKGIMKNTDENESIKHFKILLDKTSENNYIHYEISNFAREGFYSKHNSIYWLGGHYIGLGPSAHSYNGYSRQWNVSNMKKYIEAEKTKKITFEKEILTKNQHYNEYVMTALRTVWGCDLEHIQNVFGEKYFNYFKKLI